MKHEITNFDRIDLFQQYNKRDNPFLYLTTKVDITNIYKKCKHYYGSLAYFFNVAINKIDNFKYRYEDGKIYKYDEVRPNFTEMYDGENISFFSCEMKASYEEFMNNYLKVRDKFLHNKKYQDDISNGEIWFSCFPWGNISGLITPYDKSITIPQFIWDKFSFENDHVFINLTIMVHHGFVDGHHIGLFLKYFNEINENIDEYLKKE